MAQRLLSKSDLDASIIILPALKRTSTQIQLSNLGFPVIQYPSQDHNKISTSRYILTL